MDKSREKRPERDEAADMTLKPGARVTARLALRLGLLFTLVIGAFVLSFDNEASPLFVGFAARVNEDEYWILFAVLLLTAIALGMGLGTLTALFRLNRHRLRAVLRPNPGRVLSAAALAVFWPVWMFFPFPFAAGIVLLGIVRRFLAGRSLESAEIAMAFVCLLVVPVLAYVAASLIVSGVSRRLVRVALFGQVWIAAYAAALLISGLPGPM